MNIILDSLHNYRDLGLLILRAEIGIMFMYHGGSKLLADPDAILAIIIVPIILDKWDKYKQKETTSDMRTIGSGLGAYRYEKNKYPYARSIDELAPILEPYLSSIDLPCEDAWGNKFRYLAWKENPQSPGIDTYIIASPGKDGIWEKEDLKTYTKAHSCNPEAVLSDGIISTAPQHLQRHYIK